MYLGQTQQCDAVHFSALMENCAFLKHNKKEKEERDNRKPLHPEIKEGEWKCRLLHC